MSGRYNKQLYKRTNDGVNFSISFGVVAFAVVVVCAIWAFVIPQWQKKHPPKPSRTKWNDGSVLTSRSRRRTRTFPNHPAIKPLLSKPSAAQVLPAYNPRVETPFFGTPELGFSRALGTFTPRTNSAPVDASTISSNGLFTPERQNHCEDDKLNHGIHTGPKTNDVPYSKGKSTDFGDAKEFILAIPEPLTLRPRDAGRPPLIARQLETHGANYAASPAGSDKLPHPNKLFRAIQSSNVRSSLCSSTSLRVDHHESDPNMSLTTKAVVDAVDQAIEEEAEQRQYSPNSSNQNSNTPSIVDNSLTSSGPSDGTTALQQLRSYRLLTGSRAGTFTRPKTPVDELRRLYGVLEKDVTTRKPGLPKEQTVSTALTMNENSSENDSLSTPATSPILPSRTLQLLPTPLRLQKSTGDLGSGANTLSNSGVSDHTEARSEFSPSQATTIPRHEHCVNAGFYHTSRRKKPAPSNIRIDIATTSARGHKGQRSPTEPGASFSNTLSRPNYLKSQMRASSLYSQDTYGFRLLPTPATSEFPSPIVDIFADYDVCGNQYQHQESVKARIAEWTERIGGASTPTFSSLPQEPSDEVTDKVADNLDQETAEHTCLVINAENADSSGERPPIRGIARENEKTPKRHDMVMGQAPGGATWI